MANQTNNNKNKRSRKGYGASLQVKQETKKLRVSSEEHLPIYKEHNSILISLEDGQTWYQYEKSLQERNVSKVGKESAQGSTKELASLYRNSADEIFRREVQIFSGGKGDRWMETTIRKGTLKDRIAAMSVIVSQDPLHQIHALDGLLNLTGAESGGQTNARVAQMAAEALQDLFLNTLLPPDRKLKTLEQRTLPAPSSGKKKPLSPRILLLWRYEEMVKEKYASFLRNYVSKTLQEGLEVTKIAALRTASALLRSVPEGEAQILGLIVNKLGDPQKKTAAAAGHELRSVLKEHLNMQTVIAREVQQLAHRPHLSPRALYNCVSFLNQLQLERTDSKEKSLPAALITTYFKLFEVAIRSSDNRGTNNEVSAKSRLLQALLIGVNRAHPFLPEKDKHMDEHIDELYRVVHTAPPGAATQALSLLFHIAVGVPTGKGDTNTKPNEESRGREDRYYRALFSALAGTDLLGHGKHSTMFFNVLYKSLKYDRDSKRVVALAKRLLATVLHCSAPACAASLFVLNEVAGHHEELRLYLEELPDKDSSKAVLQPNQREPRAAFTLHGSVGGGNRDGESSIGQGRPSSWELSLGCHHYHPSVSKFATNLGTIKYHGDPMQDFSLAPFLDKFAYRNPRAVKDGSKHTGGAGQRRTLRKDAMNGRLEPPVNDPSFLKRKDTEAHDDFFRKFFDERKTRMDILGDRKRKKDAVDEDGALDLAESNACDFAAFENNWESDSDEEAFADSLAEKLLIDQAGGAPVDMDDDPDMDDWGDLSGGEEEEDDDDIQYREAEDSSSGSD